MYRIEFNGTDQKLYYSTVDRDWHGDSFQGTQFADSKDAEQVLDRVGEFVRGRSEVVDVNRVNAHRGSGR